MAEETECVGELTDMTDMGKLLVLRFRTEQGEDMKTSVFKDAPIPDLQKGAIYRFRTTVYNGYTNIAPVWGAGKKTGYKLEKIAERIPTATRRAAQPDARELRISRLSLTSSASVVVAALIHQGKVASAKEAEELVLEIAKLLEQYAVC